MSLKDFFKSKITEIKEVDLEMIAQLEKKEETEENKNLTKKKTLKLNEKHYLGHRNRIKEKLLNYNNLESIENYELIEALLTYSIPRVDVKPIAKELLIKFKNINSLITADQSTLLEFKNIGKNTLVFFKLINEIFCRTLKNNVEEEINLSNPELVMKYCSARMSNLRYEQFRVLFLNRKNKLIKDDIIQNGTIDKSAIFPKELIKKAMELNAGAMILVHNHPSGDSTPSQADIDITKAIKEAAKLMDIFVYDHLIIGKNKHFSFNLNNLI